MSYINRHVLVILKHGHVVDTVEYDYTRDMRSWCIAHRARLECIGTYGDVRVWVGDLG